MLLDLRALNFFFPDRLTSVTIFHMKRNEGKIYDRKGLLSSRMEQFVRNSQAQNVEV